MSDSRSDEGWFRGGLGNMVRMFGNIRPSYMGIEPSQGRGPLVDIRHIGDIYEISVELPGVEAQGS